jgi:hypothetical protein
MLKSLRDRLRAYRLISKMPAGGHGSAFPNGIREMDSMMVGRGLLEAGQHEERVQVILAYSAAFERENPDLDVSDMTPQMWAMAAFILCNAAMREDRYADASAIAAEYGLKHDQSVASIEWCAGWALEQALARRFRQRSMG